MPSPDRLRLRYYGDRQYSKAVRPERLHLQCRDRIGDL